ncbi:MAG: cupin domain-containing protein [Parcubacteria group bacterium]
MFHKECRQKTPILEAKSWIKKQGYETRMLADAGDLNVSGTEVQLVRFYQGKVSHHHKRKTEFFYFTAGTGYVVIDRQQKIELAPGSELLVKPCTYHEFVNENTAPLEAIMFKTNSTLNDTFIH